MEKLKNKPFLRFPEFENEWQLKKVGTLTNRISNPVKVQSHELYKQIGIRSHGKGIFYKEAVAGKELGNKRVFWIKENTFIVNIVFAWEQAVAKTTVNEIGMVASHRFPMYVPVEMQSDLDYLLHFFLTPKGKTLLELASPGGAGRNKTLGQKEFENLKFLIPSIDEQRKIADFLTAIDNKITQLKQKKTLLEQYKKGVMQKLFSQELRFIDENGKVFPKWEQKKFGECFASLPSKKHQIKTTEFQFEGKYKVIDQGQDTTTGYSDDKSLLFTNIPIIVFGDHTTILKYIDFDFIVGADGTKLLKNKNDSDLKYLFYNLSFNNVKQEGYKRHFTALNEIIMQIPKQPEQTKIANFLSAIDEKINRTENQIQKTQEWKKGLLQRMFV